MALTFQTLSIPFSDGLNQTTDVRAKLPPALDIAKDVQFDAAQGLQTRYPYSALGSSIFGGGTISGARKIVANGSELLLFTSDTLYSWNAQLSKWVSRGTHLAVNLDEETVFGTNGDQQTPDRAELNNTIVYAWTDSSHVYVAAIDKTTGSVVMSPTKPTEAGGGASRPRLIAMASTIMLLLVNGSGDLVAFSIDPAAVATSIAVAQTSIQTVATFNLYYDAVKIPGADTVIIGTRRQITTSYTIHKVTSALVVTSSTKARTCTGGIAVSCTPDGASVQVVRANALNVQGDLVTISSLADVYTAQAIGTTVTAAATHIAAAHRSVQNSSQYRCYVFWGDESTAISGIPDKVKTNWVDTGNTLGTSSTLQAWLGVGSRAFDYNGSIYFWAVFDQSGDTFGAIQPIYILFRDDGTIAATATSGNAYWAIADGYLPGVALVSGSTSFAWCGVYQRQVIGGFAARAPRDITFTFDSNDARRCAQFGKTLYIANGEGVMQYDGTGIVETGFHVCPYKLTLSDGGAGSMAVGTYAYKNTLRWLNARGEIDRSTSFGASSITQAASRKVSAVANAIWSTRKTSIALEQWRTAVSPTADSPFYLVSSNDPGLAGDNGYVSDSLTAATVSFSDNMTDAIATTKETNPENGSVLEPIAPPPAKIIIATQDRLFLAGIAGSPDSVWYSKQRSAGSVAQFNDGLTFEVPKDDGDITGMAFLNETLIVFRQYAIYAVPGEGFDNLGGGSNFGPVKYISSDIGAVNQESIAVTPMGLIFKSAKGWYMLNRGWGLDFIDKQPLTYNSETPLAVHVVTAQQQVRMLSASRMLIWDWRVQEWAEWTVSDGIDACVWNGTHVYLTSTGPKVQQSTYSAVDYGMDIETAWIKLADLQGFARVRKYQILGEYRSTHHLRVRFAYNFIYDGSGNPLYVDDSYWTPYPTVVGSSLHVQLSPSIQQVASVKVRITASSTADDGTAPSGGESLALTGIGLEVGIKQGLYKLLSAAQRR